MAVWLVRAGASGEWEARFLDEGRIYLCWNRLNTDLRKVASQADLIGILGELYPECSIDKVRNWASQIWPYAKKIDLGDWIALPSKLNPTVHFGKVTGNYTPNPEGPEPLFHFRNVEWFAKDVPRAAIDQDILYSLGAFMTICRIQRNDAEGRLHRLAATNWRVVQAATGAAEDARDEAAPDFDLEQEGRDRIAALISSKFRGHELTRLVAAILRCKGYTVYQSPPGPDSGVDILAAPGPLGFETPRLCVQVKSGNEPVDHPTFTHLVGAMANFQADRGLMVSWGGFNQAAERERARRFFNVRFWNSDDLIRELLAHYEEMDADLRAELPLKRVWTVASGE